MSNKELFNAKGPLLIASNHPNSFLDAIIISALFKRPVHSLARGDAFKNKFVAWLLRSLNMLPVYRTSEGVENMEHNYTTFEACKQLFKNNGIVLIFSEGRCVNEWHLRALKKGTARLAISSWQEGIDLKILPLGINYQGFKIFGKNIHLNFGSIITKQEVDLNDGFGKSVLSFNNKLQNQLQPLVYEVDKDDLAARQRKFAVPVSGIRKILLFIPALAGYVIHFPLLYAVKKVAGKLGGHNDHYDSFVIVLLFLSYPFYALLLSIFIFFAGAGWFGWLSFLWLPFLGWSYMQLKKQF